MADTIASEGTSRTIRHKTLSTYYPVIQTLRSLLSNLPIILSKDADRPAYTYLLDKTLCASVSRANLDVLAGRLKSTRRETEGSQQELIDRMLRDLGRTVGKNVLLSSNRYPAVELPINLARPHVDNRYIHSPSSVLRGVEWKLLRSRIGDEAFRLAVAHTSLFLPVGNNCYSQLTGKPIYDLYDDLLCGATIVSEKGKRKRQSCEKGRKKRRKLSSTPSEQKQTRTPTTGRVPPAEVKLARQGIFYGRPHRLPNGAILVGLPPQHPLAKLASLENPTNLQYLKYLQSIFGSMFRRRLGLEDESICVRGSQERVEGMTGMIKELVARYRKVNFKQQLDRCTAEEEIHNVPPKLSCPSTSSCSRLITQAFPSSPDDASQMTPRVTTDLAPLPPSLEAVPHRQVCRFVTSIFRQLLPATIMGSQHNSETLLAHVRRFIKAKQYEPTNLHTVVQGLRMTDLPWLDLRITQRSTSADATKRLRLVEDFVKWIFDGLLVPLLRNTFYVTETATTRYETVYYTHEAWFNASRPHFLGLQETLLTELDKDQSFFARQGELGVSAVRLIPKPTGFRPIVNLGRRIKRPGVSGISTFGSNRKALTANQILKGVHQVLTFEKDRHRAQLGASLFGTNEIFAPLQLLRDELQHKHGAIPHLYFVKMDIKAAFDSIKQDKMLDIVSALLDKNHDYCLMLYCLLLPLASKASQGSARRRFKSCAVVDDHLASSFGYHAKEIAQPLRNAVVVDLVKRKQVTRAECMKLLQTHIQHNVWQVGKKLYRQKTGIPQGSKISSLLCSFFYAHMENEHLGFTRRPGSRLLRYIDDFLFITDDLFAARRFVDTMSRGFPAYGAEVSKSKTLLSFECDMGDEMGTVVQVNPDGQTLFPYCGFLIRTKTLEVMSDYPRMMTGPVRQSFALRTSRCRGAGFVGWFSRQLENRNQVAYLDTKHNTLGTVHFNIFVNFALTTMKVPHYFRGEEMDGRREEMIAKALCTSAEYTFVAGRARVRHASRASPDPGDHYGVTKLDFLYLAKSAMVKVLSRKAAKFKGLVDLLEKDMRNGHRCKLSATHAETIDKGWQAVKNAQF